jgi:DNA-binding NarL/FixJ family response regulator
LLALREVYPQTRVAVLTGTEDRATILDCLGAGVHGYILKSGAAETMLQAIETLLAGGVYVPAMITRVAAAAPPMAHPHGPGHASTSAATEPALSPLAAAGGPVLAKPAGLTPRQIDVLKLLAEGRSTKDIARGLNLGLGTVKVHLAGVYRALGASNRMEAMVRAGRLKLED